MRSKLALGIALSLLAATVVAGAEPASARVRHPQRHPDYVQVVPASAVNLGPVPAATSPNWSPDYFGYVPGRSYGYGPLPYVSQGGAFVPGHRLASTVGDAVCAQRFRSYDPASGTYLGRDGRRHSCP
jgi:hypothetical protein